MNDVSKEKENIPESPGKSEDWEIAEIKAIKEKRILFNLS